MLKHAKIKFYSNEKKYIIFQVFVYCSIAECGLDFSTCIEVIWEPGTNRSISAAQERQNPSLQLFPQCSDPQKNRQAHRPNKSQTYPYQSKGRKQFHFLRTPSTFVKISYSCTSISFVNRSILETWKLGFPWKALKGFFRRMFKPSTDFILFLFYKHSAFRLGSVVSCNDPVCQNVFIISRRVFFVFVIVPSWILCQKLLTFPMDIVHKHLFQCSNVYMFLRQKKNWLN